MLSEDKLPQLLPGKYPYFFEVGTALESGDLSNLLIHHTQHAQVWEVVHAHNTGKPKGFV